MIIPVMSTIPSPFIVLAFVVMNFAQVCSVQIVPVIITSPVSIALRIAVIISAVVITVYDNTGIWIYN